MLRVLALAVGELVEPGLERPIRDELDVLEADDFLRRAARVQLAVARHRVDHLARVEADRLAHEAGKIAR